MYLVLASIILLILANEPFERNWQINLASHVWPLRYSTDVAPMENLNLAINGQIRQHFPVNNSNYR